MFFSRTLDGRIRGVRRYILVVAKFIGGTVIRYEYSPLVRFEGTRRYR